MFEEPDNKAATQPNTEANHIWAVWVGAEREPVEQGDGYGAWFVVVLSLIGSAG